MVETKLPALRAAGVPQLRPIGNVAGTGSVGGANTVSNTLVSRDSNPGAVPGTQLQADKQDNVLDPASMAVLNRGFNIFVGANGDVIDNAELETLLASGAGADAQEITIWYESGTFALDPAAIALIWSEFGGRKSNVCFKALPGAAVTLELASAFADAFAEAVCFAGVTVTEAAGSTFGEFFAGPSWPNDITVTDGAALTNGQAGAPMVGNGYTGLVNLKLDLGSSVTSDGALNGGGGGGEVRANVNVGSLTSVSDSVNVGGGSKITEATITAGDDVILTNTGGNAGESYINDSAVTAADDIILTGGGDDTSLMGNTMTATAGSVTATGVGNITGNTITAAAGTVTVTGSNNQTVKRNTFTTPGATLASGSAPGTLEHEGNTYSGTFTHAGGTLAPFAKICSQCNAYVGVATYNGDGATTDYFGTNEDYQAPASALGVGGGFELRDALFSNSKTEGNVTPTVVGAANFPANPTNI